jgi:Mrp family chromosome partitioning ATPase
LSKNFDLLTQLDRIQDVLPGNERPVFAPAPELETTETTPSTASLLLEGAVRDEVVKLVHNLFVVPGAKAPHRVVFTATESGAGCTWVTARAAEILASQVHGSVCVVDCNLRSPSLHQQFGTPNHIGLSDALQQGDPIRRYVQRLSRSNLWLLSSGSGSENWHELMASNRLQGRLAELFGEFQYVLIDAASFNTCNDGAVLGRLTDGVVLVVRANTSRREIALKALQELQAANLPVLGAVLNQRTFPIPEKIYKLL